MRDDYDVAVVGGGLLGSAIAWGLGRIGQRVCVLDEGDVTKRASRANFALVWVQSKGLGLPEYTQWTVRASDTWSRLAGDLREQTGLDVSFQRNGGFHLALGDKRMARKHLEAAWQHGFHEARVAWALALVLGRLYQEQLLEAERLSVPAQREARKQELQREYREPALAYLRLSQGPEVPSTEYVAALIALHEERFEEALALLDTTGPHLPWFYEAPLLRGDILRTRAARR